MIVFSEIVSFSPSCHCIFLSTQPIDNLCSTPNSGFDWLRRLGKRGEKFDIVIIDPPSTSVGGKKKKRWSAKNDYDELVSIAAPLVKEGGLLWTTTNSNQIHPIRFARMCKKGLVSAGLPNAKLERVVAMPHDFPSIGPQSVKNL